MQTWRDPPERLPKDAATNHDTLNARVDLPPRTLVAVPAARAMVDALLTGREAAQRHEDVAALLSEVSPTRSNAPEAKQPGAGVHRCIKRPVPYACQAVLHGHNPHSHAAERAASAGMSGLRMRSGWCGLRGPSGGWGSADTGGV